jgi:hypothetical protein
MDSLKDYFNNFIKNNPIETKILEYIHKHNKFWFISGITLGLAIGFTVGYSIGYSIAYKIKKSTEN